MSDALDTALAAEETRYRDPVAKSDVGTPAEVGPGGEPVEPKPTPEPEPEATATEQPAEPAPKAEDDKPKRDRGDDRFRVLSARLGDKTRENEELRARLAEFERQRQAPAQAPDQPGQEQQPRVPTQAEIDRLVEQRAAERIAQQRAAEESQRFTADCNRVAADGEREFGAEFQPMVTTLFQLIDPSASTNLLEAILETERPAAVLFELAQDPRRAQEMSRLKPSRVGAAVMKFANGMSAPAPAAAAPQPRPTSRAPAPVEQVAGSARANPGAMGPDNIRDWMSWEDKRNKDR